MRVTYYIPTKPGEQNALIARIKELFNVEATITERASGIDFDFEKFMESGTFADLLNIQPSQIIKSPFAKFTIEAPDEYTPEQVEIVTTPGREQVRDFDIEEVRAEELSNGQ